MKYPLLGNLTIPLSLCLSVALSPGCAGQQAVAAGEMGRLPLGLYQVVQRECAYPTGAPEDCTQTQYLELVKGLFEGVGEDETAFVTWLAPSPSQEHTYVARDLREGRFASDGEFVLEDDALGREWLLIRQGAVTDYYFLRHGRETPHGGMAGRTHLVLKPVQRHGELKRLLALPPAGE